MKRFDIIKGGGSHSAGMCRCIVASEEGSHLYENSIHQAIDGWGKQKIDCQILNLYKCQKNSQHRVFNFRLCVDFTTC